MLFAIGMSLVSNTSALGAPCVEAPVFTYTIGIFSCSVGTLTFSNIIVNTITAGNGSIALENFTPYQQHGKSGLILSYNAEFTQTNFTFFSQTDITWSYNVVGFSQPLSSGFLKLEGSTTGAAQAQVSEVLFQNSTISLNAPGEITRGFTPSSSLFVSTDQVNFDLLAFGNSSARTTLLINAFNDPTVPLGPVNGVPGPIAGGGIPGAVLGMVFGYIMILLKRRGRGRPFRAFKPVGQKGF
jgi:hypothetical protein